MFYTSHFESMEPIGGIEDELLTFVEKPNWLGSLFRLKEYKVQYRGGCTVWCSYPDGKRQGGETEDRLCGIWQRELWKRERSNAA